MVNKFDHKWWINFDHKGLGNQLKNIGVSETILTNLQDISTKSILMTHTQIRNI